MIVYKLTDQQDKTRGGTQWGVGAEHTAPGGGPLCSSAYIHAYRTPKIAVLMAPIYGYYTLDEHLWEGDADVEVDDGTKLGCTRLRTLRRVDRPVLTRDQCLTFGILSAAQLPQSVKWLAWARGWISGENRTDMAALAAVEAVEQAPAEAEPMALLTAWLAAKATLAKSWQAEWSVADAAIEVARAAEAAMDSDFPARLAWCAEFVSQPPAKV